MAYKIDQLFKKVRSERGHRIYRLGDTEIGIRAMNFYPGGNWKFEIVVLYEHTNGKVYASPYDSLKIFTIPGGTWREASPRTWRDSYLGKARSYIESQYQDLFEFIFTASFPKH